MGLLDFLNSPEARQGLGLLAAAGPSREPLSFGQRMSGFMAQQDAEKRAEEERKARAQMQAMQMQLLQAQVGETQAQAAQRQAAAQQAAQQMAEQQRIRQTVQQAFAPVSPIQANAASGVTGPRPEALAAVGQRPQVNYQALIAQGVPTDLVKALAESTNYGAPEVARTIEGRDDQGRPVTLQFDKQGRQIGQGVQQWKAPEKIDTGGAVSLIDPVTLKALQAFQKTNTPDALLGAQTTMRGQNMTDARSREANAQGLAPKYDPERGVMIDQRTGVATPVTQGGLPIGPKDKGLNDTQAKALLFGSRMQEADAVLGGMGKQGVNMPGAVRMAGDAIGGVTGGALSAAGNFTQSKDQQLVDQAQRDFINATLRRESGAAIADTEFASARRQYFPQPGDSPEVIAQKAKNRALATQSILNEVPAGQRPKPVAPTQTGGASLQDLLNKYGN